MKFKLLSLALIFISFINITIGQKKTTLVNSISAKPTPTVKKGYMLSFNTTNCNGKILELYLFKGSLSKKSKIDSIVISKVNQKIIFEYPKQINSAIMLLKFKDENSSIKLGIDNQIMADFSIENGDINSIKAHNSAINKEFIDYQTKVISKEEKIKIINNILKIYPNSIVSLFFKIEDKKNLVDTFEENNRYAEFFNDINSNDTRLILLPNIYVFLNKYFSKKPITNLIYQNRADKLLQEIDPSSKVYVFFVSWIFKNLEFYKTENLEKAYIYIYDKYVKGKELKFDNAGEFQSIATKVQLAQKLENGTQIPELVIADSIGTEYKLSEIYPKHKFTLLAFFDPDCVHCQESLTALKTYIDGKKMTTEEIQVVTVLNAYSEDIKKWKEFLVKQQIEDWMNLRSKDSNKMYQKEFLCYANPSFFLISQDGKIIDKTGEPSFLEIYFAQKPKE